MHKPNELLPTSGMIIMTPSNIWVATKISSTTMKDTIKFNDNYYKIERDESILDTNDNEFAKIKKLISKQICGEPMNIMNEESFITYANVFANIISNTQGNISYAEIKDIKKTYRDNKNLNIINYLIYEINMLYKCKEILSQNKELNRRNNLFLHHVLHKYSISLNSSSLLKKISDKIEKQVWNITSYVKNTKKDIANLQTHFSNQCKYKDSENSGLSKLTVYKDPSRPDVNFLQSVSVGMSRNTTLSSISFGLG